ACHVALRVPDYHASKSWFVEKMDFRVISEWVSGQRQLAYLLPPTNDAFYLEIIGGHTLLSPVRYSSIIDSLDEPGYHHFCLNVDSVDETIAELRRRSVRVVREARVIPEINRRIAFVADPWGNLIEIA